MAMMARVLALYSCMGSSGSFERGRAVVFGLLEKDFRGAVVEVEVEETLVVVVVREAVVKDGTLDAVVVDRDAVENDGTELAAGALAGLVLVDRSITSSSSLLRRLTTAVGFGFNFIWCSSVLGFAFGTSLCSGTTGDVKKIGSLSITARKSLGGVIDFFLLFGEFPPPLSAGSGPAASSSLSSRSRIMTSFRFSFSFGWPAFGFGTPSSHFPW